MTHPPKITFAEMRNSGVRGLLVYCSDYKCSRLMSGDRWSDAGSKPKSFDEGVYLGRARKLHPIVSKALPCLSISPAPCFLRV
jgi:hypothetical protein